MMLNDILFLEPSLQARAVETLTLAFQEDILKRTLCPNTEKRPGMTRWIMEGALRYCLFYGEVHTTPGVEGVACWMQPGKTRMSAWGQLRAWNRFPWPYFAAGRQAVRSTMEMQAQTSTIHKRLATRPHWYLLALAVRPECQGQGLGGRLLAPMMARADQMRLPCYLETQAEKNVTFYHKRGFEVLEAARISGLDMWFMLREPKG